MPGHTAASAGGSGREGAGNEMLDDVPPPKVSMENLGLRIVSHSKLRSLLRNQRSDLVNSTLQQCCLPSIKIDSLSLKLFQRWIPDGLKP